MSYSSIIRKKCKCGCGKIPTIGFKGFNMDCRPDLKEELIAKQKRKNAANRQNIQLRKAEVEHDWNIQKGKDYEALDRWFKERRKEMTGVCSNCGGKSCKDDDKYYKFSIAHLLPKAYFKSVATHPDNWLELCHFGNSCHAQMDNKMLDLIDMNCFDTIIQKFVKIYPSIANEEKRRIPPILIEYLNTET